VSVTHLNRKTDEDLHDFQRFRVIAEAVQRLTGEGLLHFVDLPLAEMKSQPGSPEGHQWGRAHHGIVGTRIAEEIAELPCK
jgi:hypothetical protein